MDKYTYIPFSFLYINSRFKCVYFYITKDIHFEFLPAFRKQLLNLSHCNSYVPAFDSQVLGLKVCASQILELKRRTATWLWIPFNRFSRVVLV